LNVRAVITTTYLRSQIANSLSSEGSSVALEFEDYWQFGVQSVYSVGLLLVPIRGWENKNGQRVMDSLTIEFEAFHEQNA